MKPGWGSSPQMRGARCRAASARPPSRIIPADAGSTTKVHIPAKAGLDHPRRCGEHLERRGQLTACAGSSPQMRGARTYMFLLSQPDRIIPADAGSTARTG